MSDHKLTPLLKQFLGDYYQKKRDLVAAVQSEVMASPAKRVLSFIRDSFFPKFDELHMAILMASIVGVIALHEPARTTSVDFMVRLFSEGFQGWIVVPIFALAIFYLVRDIWRTKAPDEASRSGVAYAYYTMQGMLGVILTVPASQVLTGESPQTPIQLFNALITLIFGCTYFIRLMVAGSIWRLHSRRIDSFMAGRLHDAQYTKKTLAAGSLLTIAVVCGVIHMGPIDSLHVMFLAAVYTVIIVKLLAIMHVSLFRPMPIEKTVDRQGE